MREPIRSTQAYKIALHLYKAYFYSIRLLQKQEEKREEKQGNDVRLEARRAYTEAILAR